MDTSTDDIRFEVPAQAGITKIGRERAIELMARNDARVPMGARYSGLMLSSLDQGLIEAGEDGDGGLHWRVTPKGAAVRMQLEATECDG